MGKLGVMLVFVILIALLAAGFFWLVNSGNQNGTIAPSDASSSASGTVPTLLLTTPSGTATSASGAENASDGTISFTIPSDFALATSQGQILARSYIPPCDADLNYCIYYDGTAYQGTNFDSAGIRIEKRADLTSDSACLTTPPTGYSNFTPTSTTGADYSISEFTPIGNAGAGHTAKGTLYRLAYNGACYEFETRIGQSQFANYPSGTIQQFTTANQTALQTEIQSILNGITLPSGEAIAFPN